MLGIAVGEIITLLASKEKSIQASSKIWFKGISIGGAYIFGYSLYKSIFAKDRFETLKDKYFFKHRTLGEIQKLEEELAYVEALNWVANSVSYARCRYGSP